MNKNPKFKRQCESIHRHSEQTQKSTWPPQGTIQLTPKRANSQDNAWKLEGKQPFLWRGILSQNIILFPYTAGTFPSRFWDGAHDAGKKEAKPQGKAWQCGSNRSGVLGSLWVSHYTRILKCRKTGGKHPYHMGGWAGLEHLPTLTTPSGGRARDSRDSACLQVCRAANEGGLWARMWLRIQHWIP